jgi:hypothetical protein
LRCDGSSLIGRAASIRWQDGAGTPSTAYVSHELTQVRLALQQLDVTDTPAGDLTAENVRPLLSAKGTRVHKRLGALSRSLDWAQGVGHVQVNLAR